MKPAFMAVDQFGQTFHGLEHPRKDLLERLGRRHADKMYQDTTDGKTRHVGYIINKQWLTVYRVVQWKEAHAS